MQDCEKSVIIKNMSNKRGANRGEKRGSTKHARWYLVVSVLAYSYWLYFNAQFKTKFKNFMKAMF